MIALRKDKQMDMDKVIENAMESLIYPILYERLPVIATGEFGEITEQEWNKICQMVGKEK